MTVWLCQVEEWLRFKWYAACCCMRDWSVLKFPPVRTHGCVGQGVDIMNHGPLR